MNNEIKNELLNKVNKTDLAVLTALEIFEPKIYNYLKNNKDSLYEFKKNFTTALELSKRVNKNYLGKLLSKLFPNMEDENIEIERTIKNRDYFEAYFSLSIDNKIYNKQVDDFLEKLVNKEQFILEINNVLNEASLSEKELKMETNMVKSIYFSDFIIK